MPGALTGAHRPVRSAPAAGGEPGFHSAGQVRRPVQAHGAETGRGSSSCTVAAHHDHRQVVAHGLGDAARRGRIQRAIPAPYGRSPAPRQLALLPPLTSVRVSTSSAPPATAAGV